MAKGKHSEARMKAQGERFAQLLAQGKTPCECYAAIFPKTKRPERNVGRYLKMHPEIEQRASEIASRAVDVRQMVLSRAQELAAVDKAFVLGGLLEVYKRCMQHRPVLDRDGDMVYVETPTGQIAPAYAYDAKNATRALHLLGLEQGMFVHRHAIVPDPFSNLPLPLLKQIMDAIDGMKGRVIEHADGQSSEPAGVPRLAEPATA